MTSLRMRAVATYLRFTVKPRMATSERARDLVHRPKKPSPPPADLDSRHHVTQCRINGFDCYSVKPRGRQSGRAAMYLHGGGYFSGIHLRHWHLISQLADAGVRVEVPLYGLAPQYTHRDAYPFVTEVYEQLLAEVDAQNVTVAGDSAGAGLALGLTQTLSGAGLSQPRNLVLISPWLDLTLSNPAVRDVEPRDPWLSKAGLVEAGRYWADQEDPTHHRLSPINGPLSQLPRTDLYIGTRDLFHPDALRLRDLAEAAGTELHLAECKGAVHDYPLVPTPEGRTAVRKIVQGISL